MSLAQIFSDNLSILNNRQSLVRTEIVETTNKVIATPPHNIGDSNLLVYKNGVLLSIDIDYEDTSSTFITLVEPPVLGDKMTVILFRTGADYSSSNENISQLYHGTGSPGFEGKNDDYFLDVLTGNLYSHSNGDWSIIFSIGSGGGASGLKKIYESLAETRNNTINQISLLEGETPFLVFLNGFLLSESRDFTFSGTTISFSFSIDIYKDIVIYSSKDGIATVEWANFEL